MSTTIHHAIVVTGYELIEAHNYAVQLFDSFVTEIITSINGTETFCIVPDGSNDGWEKSRMYDKARALMIAKLKELKLYFVEIEYGENGTKIGDCYDRRT